MKWKGKINFADRPLYADYGLITVSETDTISGSLQTDIDTKSDNGHIHDDRYYTESEVDNLITTVSGKLDDHNELNNLDYVSAGHTGFQPSGNYATDSELTTLSGVLKNDIDGKSDIGHNHDDLYYTETELNEGQLDTRYYTESEVDTISGSLDTAKSDIDHSHIESDISNLDKYTQGEVDSLITTISGKLDDHNELNNLDYASAGHTGFQPAGDYATDAELTSASGTLQTDIDTKADKGVNADITSLTGLSDIKLDSLLSADGEYSGLTCDGVLGATLSFGDLVYLNTTDQRWELADADVEATAGDVMLAVVTASGIDGDTSLLFLQGFIREDDWNFTAYGQALYVGLTAGNMVQDVSAYTTGDIVRVIGYASTFANQIYFNPSGAWLEIT